MTVNFWLTDWRLMMLTFWLTMPTYASHTDGSLAKVRGEDKHRGRSRLGSKKKVWCNQGFTNCTKQTDSAGTCTPCNNAAWNIPVLSEVEEEVTVCVDDDSMEMWVGLVVEEGSSLTWSVCTSVRILVHHSVSICTSNCIIISIPVSAGVPDKPEITTNEARLMAGLHFGLRYLVCPATGKGLPFALRMAWWLGLSALTWPYVATRSSEWVKTPRHLWPVSARSLTGIPFNTSWS